MSFHELNDPRTGGSAYLIRDEENNRYYYTQEMMDDSPSWGDLCSGTAVVDVDELATVDDDVTIDTNHAPDVQALEVANRAIDSFWSQDDDYRETARGLEFHEIAALVAKRAGVYVYAVEHDASGYGTEVTENLEFANYICFHAIQGADGHGREFAAQCNGTRWSVYVGQLDRLEQWIEDDWGTMEDFDYSGQSEDSCHGYTWNNLDEAGQSTPTEDELKGAY